MVQFTAVMLTVDVTRMTTGTSQSWFAIFNTSASVWFLCNRLG